MVGEAHLVGEANIFNVKYIIHECGLPTFVDRRQVGNRVSGKKDTHHFASFFKARASIFSKLATIVD